MKTTQTLTNTLDIALEALERIAVHEKECGERWAEATVELRELKKSTEEHSARWEKVAWVVIGAAGTTLLAVLSTVVS